VFFGQIARGQNTITFCMHAVSFGMDHLFTPISEKRWKQVNKFKMADTAKELLLVIDLLKRYGQAEHVGDYLRTREKQLTKKIAKLNDEKEATSANK